MATPERLGASLTSLTVTWNSTGTTTRPSLTVNRTVSVLPPDSSLVTQATCPLSETVNPAGPLTRRNTRACLGSSESVATTARASALPSSRVCLEIVATCGGAFTSLITNWNSDATV